MQHRDMSSIPHHDGSATYVSDLSPEVGDSVTAFLRVPRASGVRRALLRTCIDGEQSLSETTVDRETDHEVWLRGDICVQNPVLNYRWLLDGAPEGYQWLNGEGTHPHDVTDAADFRITTHPAPPSWAADAVLYQVFPDRFATSAERTAPDWAIPQAWDDPVIGSGPETPFQYYGGDLDGIAAHLDHIASTGANTVYLTPIFPARSNHRYDATTFEHVDPLLGGDAALGRLSAAVHARGMRLIGDLTTNHCGADHEWFRRAQRDAACPEAGYFSFEQHPDQYVCWFGFPSLPKFDHRDAGLRRALYEGPGSTVARWLGPGGGLDGWRIDVANMTGRLGRIDLNHQVATTLRATMAEANPESLLLAEHSHDASHDLLGDGWHGVMNYAGFARPVWQWLKPAAPVRFEPGPFTPLARVRAGAMVTTMRAFAAAQPWRATSHALNLVGSHDVARIATFLGNEGLVTVAFGLLATMPGIPMLWAGDEIGQEGVNGEDGRRPFPWDPGRWNLRRLATNRALFAARAQSPALRHGGLRWLGVSDDAVTFLREAPGESVLVHAARAEHAPVRLPTAVVGEQLIGLAGTTDLQAGAAGTVTLPADGPAFSCWRLA